MKKAVFTPERATKNTVRFNEQVHGLDVPVIGVLYVQKTALQAIGYREGQDLVVNLSTTEEDAHNGK